LILILNRFKTGDFEFDFKSLFRCVILILISNHFTSDLSQHCLWLRKLPQLVLGQGQSPEKLLGAFWDLKIASKQSIVAMKLHERV